MIVVADASPPIGLAAVRRLDPLRLDLGSKRCLLRRLLQGGGSARSGRDRASEVAKRAIPQRVRFDERTSTGPG